MDPITQQTTLAAAGGMKDPVYVDDVFSTFLYTGNLTARSINNGIDLDGEGGMVWVKTRNTGARHGLFDTERGTGKVVLPNENWAQVTDNTELTSFNSNGFSLGDNSGGYQFSNINNNTYASWTFRKAKGFFDVVTWSGNNTAGRTIPHNLGSVPGSIWVKNLNVARDWCCYHRGVDASNPSHYKINLNKTDARANEANIWNDTEPTSTVFTVGSDGEVNATGETYVAYIFAHDDQSFGEDGDESIIKCGSYTPSSNPEGATTVNLGFEPQWVLIKNATNSSQYSNWMMFDNMRGVFTSGEEPPFAANLSDAENSGTYTNAREYIEFTPTGFIVDPNNSQYTAVNTGGQTYIYIAIRRPHKPPSAATEVFALDTQNSGSYSSPPYYRSNFVVDTAIRIYTPDMQYARIGSRMTDEKFLETHSTDAEGTNSSFEWDYNNGYGGSNVNSTSTDVVSYMFKRAPGFFDVVTYAGHQYRDSSTNISSVPHNLGVVPEMIWIKSRTLSSSSSKWVVYHKDLGTSSFGILNDSGTPVGTNYFVGNTPTNSVFKLFAGGFSTVDYPPNTYVAFLFATLPGVSKVGSYTGTGSDLNIDCGFTNGARFVLIKRGDDPGDWYVWDTTRGIVAGNDPYIRLNSAGAEVTNTDYIDPLNAGFTVTSSASGDLNASGGTYIFYAIA